jgi:hypothetical protein
MKIEIESAELLNEDTQALFNATIQRAKQFTSAERARIFLNERVPADANEFRNPGWLEFSLQIFGTGGRNNSQFIGCIQRSPGGECEFHS